ncbi:MAG: DUF6259 domain-containing protein [Oligosphaeraceae bacterium]
MSLRFFGAEDLFPGGEVRVSLRFREQGVGRLLEWGIELDLKTERCVLEWVDFPVVRLRAPGEFRYLTTFAEGTLMEREGLEVLPRLLGPEMGSDYLGYAASTIRFLYPGALCAKFHAVLRGEEGFLVQFEGSPHAPALLEAAVLEGDGPGECTLRQQHFTQGEERVTGVVMAGFRGGWEGAAELHRGWLETQTGELRRNDDSLEKGAPAWYGEDPLMLIYPIQGEGSDHGDMGPNRYFPYLRGMEVVDRWHALLPGVPLMPLLMHWEGTAPWAPPFVWPPLGGEEELEKFIHALHAQGDRLGLYASGIGWTKKSAIHPAYDCQERFRREKVDREICTGPKGERHSSICRQQRDGYDLCPSRAYTRDVVAREVSSCRQAGVDYLQFFDQNCGGAPAFCYSSHHGHPRMPGAWLTQAMDQVMARAAQAAGKEMALGCENAAATPYVRHCRINDMRYGNAWIAGRPVPLQSFLMHDYSVGFSGNLCALQYYIDYDKTPHYPLFHLAWHFVYGNMLALNLQGEGKAHWNWCMPWDVAPPPQGPLLTLLRHLLEWRRGEARPFLLYGRMDRAPKVQCRSLPFFQKECQGREVATMPAVLCAQWRHGGRAALLLVNYTEEPQAVEVTPSSRCQPCALHQRGAEPRRLDPVQSLTTTVPPLDAILLDLSDFSPGA